MLNVTPMSTSQHLCWIVSLALEEPLVGQKGFFKWKATSSLPSSGMFPAALSLLTSRSMRQRETA